MPYVQNDDVEIYFNTVGDGYPIVLQHGLTGTHNGWYGEARGTNYVDALSDKYQVILLDARGHGKSGKPHAPEKYAMKHMVGDIVSILNELEIKEAAFWGYSMGGRIGLAAAKYAPDRFSAYVIGGHGLSEKDSSGEMEELQGYISLLETGVEATIEYLEKGRGSKLLDWEYEKWRTSDFDALIAYMSYNENIGMADYLPKVAAPFLFYVGSEDAYPLSRVKFTVEIMQNAELVSLPGLTHSGASTGSKQPLPYVLRFLEKTTNR